MLDLRSDTAIVPDEAMRRPSHKGQNPPRLQENGHQFVMGAIGTAQAQKSMS